MVRTLALLLLSVPPLAWARSPYRSPPASPIANVPARGYLDAHRDAEAQPLLGGTLKVHLEQKGGDAALVLPAQRALDPSLFGTARYPELTQGVPMVNGLPTDDRAGGPDARYQWTKLETVYSDSREPLQDASVTLEATDATATDAKASGDDVKLSARWKYGGHAYELKCCTEMEHSGESFPTFGGVATNQLVHGFTRVGSPLYPTSFAYVAFWGKGELLQDGKQLEKDLPMHGMLVAPAKSGKGEPAFDDDVKPAERELHLVIPPDVKLGAGGVTAEPIHTGMKRKDGSELPALHLVFEKPTVRAERK